MEGIAAKLASNHLLDINSNIPVFLDQKEKDAFHINIAKLLFLSQWARLDIELAVGFLCTCVKAPDQ